MAGSSEQASALASVLVCSETVRATALLCTMPGVLVCSEMVSVLVCSETVRCSRAMVASFSASSS
jgi:hypothetical protein